MASRQWRWVDPVKEVVQCRATRSRRYPLRGRHLRSSRRSTLHWTTSFLGVTIVGGPQPAQLLGPPQSIRAAASPPGGRMLPPQHALGRMIDATRFYARNIPAVTGRAVALCTSNALDHPAGARGRSRRPPPRGPARLHLTAGRGAARLRSEAAGTAATTHHSRSDFREVPAGAASGSAGARLHLWSLSEASVKERKSSEWLLLCLDQAGRAGGSCGGPEHGLGTPPPG